MKTLHWIGSAMEDLRSFPASARAEAGTDLRRVQAGGEPRNWKPIPEVGRGTREIRTRTRDGIFRVFYVVESAHEVYVLHAFQKKSQKTASSDLELGKARYRMIP